MRSISDTTDLPLPIPPVIAVNLHGVISVLSKSL